jgi:N-acyl-D-aspartate/D-glutamate deacylase
VATHVPHGAVRAYVMGERGRKEREADRRTTSRKMAAIVAEGVKAGALGFSTSRTILHKSIDGELVPGTTAEKDELIAIGRAMGEGGPRRVRNGQRFEARVGRIRLDGRDEPRNRPARHLRHAAVHRQGTAVGRTDGETARANAKAPTSSPRSPSAATAC